MQKYCHFSKGADNKITQFLSAARLLNAKKSIKFFLF